MENNFGTGTLVINEKGNFIVLISDGLQTEMNANGPTRSYYEGLTLPNLGKWKGSLARKVGHIDDIVLPFLKTIDRTPATKEDSELSDKELLQKVLADNKELRAQVAAIKEKNGM